MPYQLSAYGLSDMGLVRQNNEDVWGCLADEHLFVLADGMGGHQAGEIAAKEAVLHMCSYVKRALQASAISHEESVQGQISAEHVRGLISDSIEDTNRCIFEMSRSHELLKGMGTTLSCLYFHDDYVISAHVGDSRIYRLRGSKLEQLTQDDSLLRELRDRGASYEIEKDEQLYKSIITKAVGTDARVEPTVNLSIIIPEDIYLICSDGLSDMLSRDDIERILATSHTVEEKVRTLIHAAKQKGGYDNITVVLIEVAEQSEYEE